MKAGRSTEHLTNVVLWDEQPDTLKFIPIKTNKQTRNASHSSALYSEVRNWKYLHLLEDRGGIFTAEGHLVFQESVLSEHCAGGIVFFNTFTLKKLIVKRKG